MWGRSEGVNYKSERVNTKLKEYTLTRWGWYFKEFGAKLMSCYYTAFFFLIPYFNDLVFT